MSTGKVVGVSLAAITIVSVSSASQGSSDATFNATFTRAEISAPQCTDWNAFRAKLTGNYSSITLAGSEDPVGRTCTGADANTLCRALHDGITVSHLVCDGWVWNVDFCASSWELSADATACYCGGNYDVRPCVVTNGDWGGVSGPTCESTGNRSQVITVTCR